MSVTVASLMAKMGYNDDEFSRGMEGSEGKLSKFGGIMKAGLLSVAAIGAAGVAAIGASVIGMQDALTPVMTLTGKGTQQFKDMSAGIADVVSHSPKSPDELGLSAYTILSAGISDTTTAVQALKDANKLALAGLGSVPEATDLITSAMNNWKDANLTSTDAAQIFFGTIAAGKTTTAQLAQGFGGVAPLASALGIDLKSLMSATAALTATGMPASQAYSGLKAAFANILKPTADAEKAAASIGLTFDAASLKTKGLAGFLQEIGEKSGGSTQVLTDLFGSVEAGGAVLALTGSQAGAFADNFGIIDEKGKSLDQTAKDVSETFSNRFKIAKNAAMVHMSELGNKGLDWLAEKWKVWGPTVTEVMENVKAWIAENWPKVREVILDVFSSIKTWIDNNWPAIKDAILTTFHAIKDWIDTNWPAIRDAILSVFEDIASWVRENWPGFKQTLVDGFNTIKDIVITVSDSIKEHWPTIQVVIADAVAIIGPLLTLLVTFWEGTMQSWKNAWDQFGKPTIDAAGWAFERLAPVIEGALANIRLVIEGFTALLKGDWGGAWDALTGIFNNSWNVIKGAIGAAFDRLSDFAATLWNKGIEIIQGFLGGANAKSWEFFSWIAGLPGRAVAYVGDLGGNLWDAGIQLIQGLIGGIKAMAQNAATAARNVVVGAINSAWNAIKPGSPSREGRAMGHNLTEGFIAGMRDRKALVASVSADVAGTMVHAAQYNYSIGGPGHVQVVMPTGADGNDVVKALRDWSKMNGRIPVAVTGRAP